MSACLVSLIWLSGHIAKCRPIIDGNEKQCSQVKILMFVLAQTHTPSSFHSSKSSSTNGLWYTSISLPGCFGPWISINIIMYFRFLHSQEGRLNIRRVTCHVLWLLPHSLNGFIPSVLKPNLMFLGSLSKSGNSLSTFLHWDTSVGCLNISSCLRSSLCHRINLAWDLFLKKCFKHGITGKYHITLAGTFFLAGSPFSSRWTRRSTP